MIRTKGSSNLIGEVAMAMSQYLASASGDSWWPDGDIGFASPCDDQVGEPKKKDIPRNEKWEGVKMDASA
jgi:hypothetical protein